MKIMICGSSAFFKDIPPIHARLEELGHEVTLPCGYDNPDQEMAMQLGSDAHQEWWRGIMEESVEKISGQDAILVVNLEKDGRDGYIGGATFLEIYEAWCNGVTIFIYDDLYPGSSRDEIYGMGARLLFKNLDRIR